MKKLLQELALSAAIFAGVLFLTSRIDWMGMFNLRPTSISDQLSEWAWDVVEIQLDKETDTTVTQPVDSLMRVICRSNGIDPTSIHMVVNKTHELNAFATVGNHIILNTEMIRQVHNEGELCGVLAHELSHLQLGHIKSGITRQILLGAIFTAIGGGEKTKNLVDLTNEILQNTLTRDDETKADTQGAKYMANAHLNPREMADMLDQLPAYGYLAYLTDHPDSKRRADKIRSLYPTSPSTHRILSPDQWQELKRAVGR